MSENSSEKAMNRREFVKASGTILMVSGVAACDSGQAAQQIKRTSPSLVFATDWHTATGNTTHACRDGTKWSDANNFSHPVADRMTVVSAAGLDFPSNMANVLAIRYDGNDRYCGVNVRNGWELPSVGGALYYRLYFRFNISGAGGSQQHPVQSCHAAGRSCGEAEWKFQKPPSGDVIGFYIENYGEQEGGGGRDHHKWVLRPGLNRNQTYRIEERYERTAINTWIVNARVYNSRNTLLYDSKDFSCEWHSYKHQMSGNLRIGFFDSEALRHRMIVNQGVNSTTGSTDPDNNRIYYGGFAVSLSDWIGPYVRGEAG